MAIGKNKRLSKGKKGLKKKVVDPFSRKEWFDVKAPNIFAKTTVGKTLVNRTAGLKIASDSLKGRIFDVSLGDLNENAEDVAYRKILLKCEEVNGRNLLTNFHGMRITADKLRSIIKKWQTTVEAQADVKTTDGYLVRVFAVGVTKRGQNQQKRTTYAQSSQVRRLRKKMCDIIYREVSTVDCREMFKKLVAEAIGKEIEKSSITVFPLQNVFVRKVKILKAPKVDVGKLLELHDPAGNETKDAKVARKTKDPGVLKSV